MPGVWLSRAVKPLPCCGFPRRSAACSRRALKSAVRRKNRHGRGHEGLSFFQPSVVKMNKPFISLCPEITRANALALMDWLEDEGVTRYLSDSRSVARFIEQAIDRTQMSILTHLFNQGGRFFMAYDRDDIPVGFVRLVKTGPDCEIVLVVGDHDTWGRGLGARTVRESLKLAFFDMRANNVIARIHPDNTRSLRAFERCGFLLDGGTPILTSLSITSGRYRRLLREGALADSTT
jgi:regulator of nucleoside diphosphate kinase